MAGIEMIKVAIADDHKIFRDGIKMALSGKEYLKIIWEAEDGKDLIHKMKIKLPDVLLMDIRMPEMDGIEAARQIKSNPEFKNTLILFLTARGEEYTEIAAFESGATDYVVKPIKLRALISRINALLTREAVVPESKNDRISIGDLVIDRVQYAATFQGRALILPKKEFELLSFLAKNPNKVFNRDELLEKVWGADVFVVERTVDVHIRKLREKIPEYYIKTLKGVGYLFSIEKA